MPLFPFSKQHAGEFLERREDNFNRLIEKIKQFYEGTRGDIGDGDLSRRKLDGRFNYKKELDKSIIDQKGIETGLVIEEFNDMLKGCLRHQDPTGAFNITPSPLLDCVAAITLTNLYTPNVCWDFSSGKLCLYEKKIVRMLGKLVKWSHADGIVVTGGKQALAYAIKCGLHRAIGNDFSKMQDCVVMCSSLAHYSIEHVCFYLGMAKEQCLRIPAQASGEIDLEALAEKMETALAQNKKIAAVIAVGGGTINLIPDPIKEVKETIHLIANKQGLNYTPYLHVDSVITWAWLAFDGDTPSTCTDPEIAHKIEHVLSKLSGITYADSFAADFHKTGFCPYAAGVFIAKASNTLTALISKGYIPPSNAIFGELEPLRQTFENSRPAIPIVSIWIAIRRLGLDGLRQFVIYQLNVCQALKKRLRESYLEHCEILNDHSKGWEIVFKPHFSSQTSWDELQDLPSDAPQVVSYIENCYAFANYIWYTPIQGHNCAYPLIGFIPKYSRKSSYERQLPAFLIHPTSLHYDDKAVDELIDKIMLAKSDFDLKCEHSSAFFEETSLYAMTPPK